MPGLIVSQGRQQFRPPFARDVPGRPPRSPRFGLFLLAALLLATLTIVAHGCHPGDHDDEPAWFKADQRAASGYDP